MANNYYAASDLGNDTVKININHENFNVPSVIGDAVENEKVTFMNQAEEENYMKHFFEHLEATVTSSSVQSRGHFLVGQAAINNGAIPRRFDINNYSLKSKDDFSYSSS